MWEVQPLRREHKEYPTPSLSTREDCGDVPVRWYPGDPPVPSGPSVLPVLNQPSEVKAVFVSSGLSQYSRNTEGPLTRSSPSFSSNPGVTCNGRERWASELAPPGHVSTCPRPSRGPHALLKLDTWVGKTANAAFRAHLGHAGHHLRACPARGAVHLASPELTAGPHLPDCPPLKATLP